MKIYYELWTDCITKARSLPKNKSDWKVNTLLFISMAMALNLVLILFIISTLGITEKIFIIPIDIFPGTKIDAFVSFFLSYLLPFLIINYYFIFYKEKYKEILLKYKYRNGKLFLSYFFGSIGALILYFLIAFLVVKVF
ncbi:MAG: hypothetical protein PHV20_01350 [Bacteroidales bacterium]|nr:hypothetical protein [Bacteroidales bacterium]